MVYLGLYVICLVVFLGIDAIWLSNVMRPLFERHVGDLLRENIQIGAAVGFYLLYIVGILYFCTLPTLREGAAGLALLNGLILGFLAYGTYEFTNMTTLKGWTWTLVIFDTAWGMALTAGTAVAGYYAGRMMGLTG